jgi:hypothetical protein
MSIRVSKKYVIQCDLCPQTITVNAETAAKARASAAWAARWRRDRLGRDVCQYHPKLKGARNA